MNPSSQKKRIDAAKIMGLMFSLEGVLTLVIAVVAFITWLLK